MFFLLISYFLDCVKNWDLGDFVLCEYSFLSVLVKDALKLMVEFFLFNLNFVLERSLHFSSYHSQVAFYLDVPVLVITGILSVSITDCNLILLEKD